MPDIAATVTRVESRSGRRRSAPLRGFLTTLPRVGAPLILFVPEEGGSVARFVSSIAQRVLADPDGTVYVKTRHSVYRVELDERVAELPPPLRVSFDGYELTVAPAGPSDDAAADDAGSTD
jgi:hypothetical protein